MRAGAVFIVPVRAPGAASIGDVHATQGDGEIAVTLSM